MTNKYYHLSLIILLSVTNGCTKMSTSRRSRNQTEEVAQQEESIPSKGIKQTNLEEAIRSKNYYKARSEPVLMAKYLEHALTLAKDHNTRGDLMLELADLYMTLEKRDKASLLYSQYKTFFPGSTAIKYVIYQELVATELDSLESSHDQTKTKQALALSQQFLQEFPDDTEYTTSVDEIIQRCYLKLSKNELSSAEFYINKYYYERKPSSLQAAHKRIEVLLKDYAYHLDGGEELMSIGSRIITTSPEAYLGSLDAAIEEIREFILVHETSKEGFIARILSKLGYGT